MRQAISNPAFEAALTAEYRSINDGTMRADVLRAVLALKFKFSDGASRRAADTKMLEIVAVTGGTGLTVASIATVLTMTIAAAFAVLPAIFGGICAGVGAAYYRQAAAEQALYSDLEKAMERIIFALRAGD